MDDKAFCSAYSMPIGPGGLYPPPPYFYRGVEDIFVRYETSKKGIDTLLPPGVTLADDPPICIAWARWTPFSTFGPYHEAYIVIRVLFEDETYFYQPFIFTDSEVPLAAGREIWGYAKKLALMECSGQTVSGNYSEQMVFTVERPAKKRIMTVTLACDMLADPKEIENLPVLSMRLIPNCEANKAPSVAELVRLDVVAHVHKSADGTRQLWSGRGSVTMDSHSEVDPWYRLAPTRMLRGWFGRFDFDLTHGKVVHDYLQDEALFGRKE